MLSGLHHKTHDMSTRFLCTPSSWVPVGFADFAAHNDATTGCCKFLNWTLSTLSPHRMFIAELNCRVTCERGNGFVGRSRGANWNVDPTFDICGRSRISFKRAMQYEPQTTNYELKAIDVVGTSVDQVLAILGDFKELCRTFARWTWR